MPCIHYSLIVSIHWIHTTHACVVMFSFVSSRNEMKNEFPLPCIILSQSYAMSLIHIGWDFHTQKQTRICERFHHSTYTSSTVRRVLVSGIQSMKPIFIAVWIAFESLIFFRTNRKHENYSFKSLNFICLMDRFVCDWQLFHSIAHPIDLDSDLDCELVIVRQMDGRHNPMHTEICNKNIICIHRFSSHNML